MNKILATIALSLVFALSPSVSEAQHNFNGRNWEEIYRPMSFCDSLENRTTNGSRNGTTICFGLYRYEDSSKWRCTQYRKNQNHDIYYVICS